MRSRQIAVYREPEGLYIHVPFCHSKCYYCDFYSRRSVRHDEMTLYVDSVCRELTLRRNGKGPSFWRTIYIGGGTPSMLPLPEMKRLAALSCYNKERVEFTVEANPEDVTADWVAEMKDYGVTRISMGAQSFDDRLLKSIGRRHTAKRSIEAIEILEKAGMDYSLDVIYGLPGQSVSDWQSTLSVLFDLHPGHFSAYLLSYEPGTRLYAGLTVGKYVEADEGTVLEMYGMLCEAAARYGYRHYEISNFAIPGFEARHNNSYWEGIPYVGLGPGAHSYDGAARGYNPSDIKGYIELLSKGILPFIREEESVSERINDKLITALRTDRGLLMSELEDISPDISNRLEHIIKKSITAGNLSMSTDGHIFIPEQKWIVSDCILRELIVV